MTSDLSERLRTALSCRYAIDRELGRGRLVNYPFLSRYDPLLESVRGELRFQQLVEEVKRRWEAFEV